jgi:DNA-binding MarR family transcriptional regulator
MTSTHPKTELDLEHFLPYRLSVLSNRISQAIARIYADRFDLTITEWRVMAILGRDSKLSATAVAERAGMDKVAVSRAVAKLIRASRVTRDMDNGDRRRSELELSETGRRIYTQVVPMALAFERRLMSQLNAQEHSELSRMLDALALNLARFDGHPR